MATVHYLRNGCICYGGNLDAGIASVKRQCFVACETGNSGAELAETPGSRLYLIRLALGDGVKNPMRIEDFVALVRERTGTRYAPSAISRSENGERRLTLEDALIFAAVDPRKRGPDWLAWGERQGSEAEYGGKISETDARAAQAELNAKLAAQREEREATDDPPPSEAPPADPPARRVAGGPRRRGNSPTDR